MIPKAVVFDIGNVLIEWQPERFYDAEIGEDKRRAMFAVVDLHAMNDRVDRGENFTKMVEQCAKSYPDWTVEIMMWHDRWLDMANPAIDHSVRLMAALQDKGTPVFSLTNFGIETYEPKRNTRFCGLLTATSSLVIWALSNPIRASIRCWRKAPACPAVICCSLMTAPKTSPQLRCAAGKPTTSQGRKAGPISLLHQACSPTEKHNDHNPDHPVRGR